MVLNYTLTNEIVNLRREDVLKLDFDRNGQLDKSGFLSNERVYEIFDDIFSEISRNKTKSSDERTLIYVASQPASGKSILVDKIKKENVNYVYIDGDSFRSKHPNSNEFKTDPDSYVSKTSSFSVACIKLAIARCLDEGYSFILETTMRNLQDISATTKQAKEAGFKINFNLMIVKPKDTYISTIYRHQKFIENGLSARKVEDEIHDSAFCGVINFATDTLLNKNKINIFKDECKFFTRDLRELGHVNNETTETEKLRILNNIRHEIRREPTENETKNNTNQLNYIKKKINKTRLNMLYKRLNYLNNTDEFIEDKCKLVL